MRVIVMIKATAAYEAGRMSGRQLLEDMDRYNAELARAGIMLAGEGLRPSGQGVRVRFAGKQRTVVEGPFAETKELLAGFWLWQVRSMDEAIEWVRRCPNPHGDCTQDEGCEIEIRPVFEADDFGEAFTPELRAREEARHAALAARR